MNKSDIVKKLASNNNINRSSAKMMVDSLFTFLGNEIAKGNRVEIRGFGAFTLRRSRPRVVRNVRFNQPSEKEIVVKTVNFRAGKELATRINVHIVDKF